MEQANQIAFEKKPRQKKERRVEKGELSAAERAEVERRLQIRALEQRTRELDEELFAQIKRPAVTLEESLERIETVDSMRDGRELDCYELGESGRNLTTRRIYEGEPPRIAYVKPQTGEISFERDPETGTVKKVSRVWNPNTQSIDKHYESMEDDAEESLFSYHLNDRPNLLRTISEHYGIEVGDVPLNPESLTMRLSIDVEKGAIREYIASRIDELFHFDVVPLTVLRAEEDLTDISSVQEAVRSSDPERPVRSIELEDLADLKARGTEHPAAKSFIRIACLDYLIKSTDRHCGNILYDPAREKYIAIDNGYSMGLSEIVDKKSRPADPLLTVPLELLQIEQDWKLDDEALEELKRVYEATKEYLALRQNKKSLGRELDLDKLDDIPTTVGKGKEIKYISKLFRTLYGNERIATKEALEFMKRVKKIIDLGRPPQLGPEELSYLFSEEIYQALDETQVMQGR
ncbi:hypothetical protein KKD88_00865 [Patescibacteria group bacterium]|nr:hypothetical protein [Patescibacteria group bacterium]MBU1629610.1 hypothetical protein [Patescibacteria group bacterium]